MPCVFLCNTNTTSPQPSISHIVIKSWHIHRIPLLFCVPFIKPLLQNIFNIWLEDSKQKDIDGFSTITNGTFTNFVIFFNQEIIPTHVNSKSSNFKINVKTCGCENYPLQLYAVSNHLALFICYFSDQCNKPFNIHRHNYMAYTSDLM